MIEFFNQQILTATATTGVLMSPGIVNTTKHRKFSAQRTRSRRNRTLPVDFYF